MQFVFAGKAHPADNPGKAFIQEIYKVSRDPEFAGKIVILENYDMNVARQLVQGVDIWLNNPRRPLEASGTSGMKASFNGAPNFSVLDGWWREGYDGTNGWPIGEEREYTDLNIQDDADAFSMYETLENTIVPLYYGKDAQGQNHGWLGAVRRAIITVSPEFSMQRQVIDYVQKYYLPLGARADKIDANHFEKARALGGWKSWVSQQWQHVQIHATAQLPATVQPGEEVKVSAQVIPAGIQESELLVEAVLKHGEPDLARADDVLGRRPVSGQHSPDRQRLIQRRRAGPAVLAGSEQPAGAGPDQVGLSESAEKKERLTGRFFVGAQATSWHLDCEKRAKTLYLVPCFCTTPEIVKPGRRPWRNADRQLRLEPVKGLAAASISPRRVHRAGFASLELLRFVVHFTG